MTEERPSVQLKIMEKEKIIELKNVKKNFGTVNVLNHFDLSINKGEFMTILGASGCGKTTLLRLIAGLEKVDEGKIYISNQDVTQLEPHERNVNMVFQSYALFPFMNVKDNIGYSLKIRKKKKSEIKEAVEKALDMVQLTGYEKRMPNQLSGGQKQRVAIARALVNQSEILLLDEPLSALDFNLRQQMQKELKQLQKKLGITFVYITHDQEEALNMSDQIVVMNQGKIEQIGTPEEIYNRPATEFVAEFVGKANILQYENKKIALRSEWIQVDQNSNLAQMQGIIVDKEFVMGLYKLMIQTQDGQKIEARSSNFSKFEIGEKVYLHWKAEKAVLLS